ncbi:NAD(P)H-dependent oxidoreductase [Solidesulfovibrio sp.]
MACSVILAHPAPGSFNHALARAACDALAGVGREVRFHDLYAEGFDPRLPAAELGRDAPLDADLARHCDEAAAAEGFVIVHPNWWGMPPAVLTGWVDRVLRPGVAYEFTSGDGGEGVPRGLLAAKAAVILNTSNTAAAREQHVFGDPLQRIWKDCIFDLCGVADVRRRMFETIVTSTPAKRRDWLAEATTLVAQTFGPAA